MLVYAKGQFGRWIILPYEGANVAWSGSRWVMIGGPIQSCNFTTQTEAEAFAWGKKIPDCNLKAIGAGMYRDQTTNALHFYPDEFLMYLNTEITPKNLFDAERLFLETMKEKFGHDIKVQEEGYGRSQ